MIKAKSSIALLALTLVFLLGATWHFWHDARGDEERLLSVSKQQSLTREEMIKLKQRVAAANEAQRSLQAAAEKRTREGKPHLPPEKPTAPILGGIAEMLRDDPVIQAKWLLAARAEIRTTYNPFYQKRNLTPDQIRKFEENTLDREEQIMDFQAAAQSQGLTPKNPAYGEFWGQQQTVYEAKVRSLLGDSDFVEWQQYERTKNVREMVSGFAGTAVLMGQPYTMQQAEDLAQALVKTSHNYQGGGAASIASINWTDADVQAQKILSPEQFDLFTSTESIGPTGGGARHQNQFWALVANGRKQDEASTGR